MALQTGTGSTVPAAGAMFEAITTERAACKEDRSRHDAKSLPQQLYLVGAQHVPAETQDEKKEKAAFEDLEDSFKVLTSRKIKNKLSAFLPDIPGDLDFAMATESTLRSVIDRPPIGEREFQPLTELQGFKLLPGALPEHYRRNFPTEPARHEHRKKHKHKRLEVKKHETAAMAIEPHPAAKEGSSHIPAAHMIQGAQVTGGASSSLHKPTGGGSDKKKKSRKRKHEGGVADTEQAGAKKMKKKSKKKDKEKEKVTSTSYGTMNHAPL